MPIHNDLERASRDPYYRFLYEGERAHERTMKSFPRVPNDWEAKKKKKEEEERKRKREVAREDEATVICTQLHQEGFLTRSDYLLGQRYVRDQLTARHQRGYHAWAISAVRLMRRSKRWTRFWSHLANARADHIAFFYGDISRRNRVGALLCAVGHPLCYAIGGLVAERDWKALYRADRAHNA